MIILLFLELVTCNLLDNIFANHGAPYVYIPSDFKVSFGQNRTNSPYILKIEYSTKYKAAHLVGKTKFGDSSIEVANVYVNITANEFYVHNIRSKCQLFEGPSFGKLISSQSGNDALIVEPEVVFRLVSLYVGTGDDDMSRYEITSLFSDEKNRAFALFDQNGQLDSIEVNLSGQPMQFYVIDPLTQVEFTENDFAVPKNWKCNKDKIKINKVEELISKILFT